MAASKRKSPLNPADRRQRAAQVLALLTGRYPVTRTMLEHEDPWQLLVATVLSAQCTDARVNQVTPELFRRWPGPRELAAAPLTEVEQAVRSTGFYHHKARNIIGAACLVMENYGGDVPRTMEELIKLPGVARKTANVVLWGGFGINEGLAVDTHVGRISLRLGLTSHEDPIRVEKDLMELFPPQSWGDVNHRMVWFGRDICRSRSPLCAECEMASFCPSCKASA